MRYKSCPYCKITEDWAFACQPRIVCLNCRYYYLANKERREYEKIYEQDKMEIKNDPSTH